MRDANSKKPYYTREDGTIRTNHGGMSFVPGASEPVFVVNKGSDATALKTCV